MLKLVQNKRVKISGDMELKDRLVGVQRVVKVTKGGRAFGFSAIVVVGDEKSVVGIGLGKSKDVATAIQKAIDAAKKNLVRVLIYKGTIPHEQSAKFSGSQVLIKLGHIFCHLAQESDVVDSHIISYTFKYCSHIIHIPYVTT